MVMAACSGAPVTCSQAWTRVRELNSGTAAAFELWELPEPGYLLVEMKTHITGCTVLANTTGRCGWVAATIVMRYWHARTGKLLIPTAHRSGNNIKVVARPDFADLIRNGRSESVFSGLAVADGMGYHAVVRQKINADAWYNLLSLNVDSALKAGRPVILLGSL